MQSPTDPVRDAPEDDLVTSRPLSQGRIEGHRERFIDAVFAEGPPPQIVATDTREDLARRIVRGGFPEYVDAASAEDRREWMTAYVEGLLDGIPDAEDRAVLRALLGVLASRAGWLLNLAELSRTTGITRNALDRYLTELSAVSAVRLIPPLAGEPVHRHVEMPKMLVTDTGLLCHLLGLDAERLLAEPDRLGPVLEDFVATELLKQMDSSDTSTRMLHFRTAHGKEADIVLEDGTGRVVGIEVKASASLTARELRGLRGLTEVVGTRFHRGVVLCTCEQTVPVGPDIWAMPIESLWKA